MMDLADVSLVDAVRMMTSTPASILKVSDRIGTLEKGKDADLVIFDDRINIKQVMIKGRLMNS
jgi:N-acetylglucosamine-6-phosphate deacetylase